MRQTLFLDQRAEPSTVNASKSPELSRTFQPPFRSFDGPRRQDALWKPEKPVPPLNVSGGVRPNRRPAFILSHVFIESDGISPIRVSDRVSRIGNAEGSRARASSGSLKF